MRRLLIMLLLPVGLAASAGVAIGEADDQAVGLETMRRRLASLEQEIAAEREALGEVRQRRAETMDELRAERRRLAEQAISFEQERLKLQRELEELDERVGRVEQRATDARRAWRRVRDAMVVLADQTRLYAEGLPGRARIGEQLDAAAQQLSNDDALAGFSELADAVDQLDAGAQSVNVREVELRTAAGRVEGVSLLSIGHVGFAYRAGDRIGMSFAAPADADGYRWREDLPEDLRASWLGVFEAVERGGAGPIHAPLDATGRIRAEVAIDRSGPADFFAAGGPVMWPLAALAGLCLILLIERGCTLYIRNGSDPRLASGAIEALRRGQPEAACDLAHRRDNSVGRTLAAMLDRRNAGQHAMEDSVQEQLLYEWPRLNRFLRGIGILAAVAPLLGLLGTVTGIIETFSVIRTVGNTNPSMMAGGISEALLTTATGLTIAIPVLLLNGIMRGRVDRILAEAEEQAASVLNVIVHDRPGPTSPEDPERESKAEADDA